MGDRRPQYEPTPEDFVRLRRVRDVARANPDAFKEAGQGLDERYSIKGCVEDERTLLPRPEEGRDWKSRSTRFFRVLEELQRSGFEARVPVPGWKWASFVLLIYWIVCDENAERGPILTDFQRWKWEQDTDDDLPRLSARHAVVDWPSLNRTVDLALAAAEHRGLSCESGSTELRPRELSERRDPKPSERRAAESYGWALDRWPELETAHHRNYRAVYEKVRAATLAGDCPAYPKGKAPKIDTWRRQVRAGLQSHS